MPLPGAKKADSPQAAKAKEIPPSHQFQYFVTSENCPRQIIQIIIPKAMAIKANPIPRSSSRLSQVAMVQLVICSHVVLAQLVISGQNQYIKPAAMIITTSLITGGEAIKLKKRFQRDCPFLVFRRATGLAVLLLLGIALLHLYSRGENHWAASRLLVEELTQGIFDFGIDEAPFKWTSTAAI